MHAGAEDASDAPPLAYADVSTGAADADAIAAAVEARLLRRLSAARGDEWGGSGASSAFYGAQGGGEDERADATSADAGGGAAWAPPSEWESTVAALEARAAAALQHAPRARSARSTAY